MGPEQTQTLTDDRRLPRRLLNEEVSASVRARVIRDADHVCHYCECHWANEVDHVRPVTHGGRRAQGNLVAACRRCNKEKGGRAPAGWRDWRRSRGMPWPPPNCTFVLLEVLPGASEEQMADALRAMKARDSRVTSVVTRIHDRHHAGRSRDHADDHAELFAAVAVFAAERDV